MALLTSDAAAGSPPPAFKLAHGGLLRRIAAPPHWADLTVRARDLFGLPPNAVLAATYVDDDGDRITVDTEGEYADLVALASAPVGGKVLKLDLEVGTNGGPVSGSVAVPPGEASGDAAYVMVDEGSVREGMEKMVRKTLSCEGDVGLTAQQAIDTPRDSMSPPLPPGRSTRPFESPRPSSPPAYDDTYPLFLAAVQPLVDQLLVALDSAPREHIPRLLGDLSGMLASRNWGLAVQGEDGMPVEPAMMEQDNKSGMCSAAGDSGEVDAPENSVPVWYGVVCDGCMAPNFAGTRWKCDECASYDLCPACQPNAGQLHNPTHTFTSIASYDFFWPKVVCDGCNRTGIAGNRYKCEHCQDFDLCSKCFEKADEIHVHGKVGFANLGTRGEDRARKQEHLRAMGFQDERANLLLLNRFDNDIQKVGLLLLSGIQFG